MTRRELLGLLGGMGIAAAASGCAARSLPLRQEDVAGAIRASRFAGLVSSLTEEFEYDAEVDGKMPTTLRGSLFRNGPGLFERAGLRRRSLMDGDGMVRAFHFLDRRVRFVNRFVRTEKFTEESAAGAFLYPSFSTQAPGGASANFWAGSKIKSQAQISVVFRNEKLYAFDESALPYELDPSTLATTGVATFGLKPDDTLYSAHPKIDPLTNEWIHFGIRYGAAFTLHVTVFAADGSLAQHRTIKLPRKVYFHDFFITRNHLVFHLHPLEIEIASFLLGRDSMADALRWRPGNGSVFLVLPRHGNAPPHLLETEASFMWHTVNAFEQDGSVVADFIGYRSPDHFLGPDAPTQAVMEGREGSFSHGGEYRRLRLDLAQKTVSTEVLDRGNIEWPMINPVHRCSAHRYAYVARTRPGDFFWSGLSRLDTAAGSSEDFFFEPGMFCGEPVFAPLPGIDYTLKSDMEPGYLLTEVYDSGRAKSFLAVFRADRISAGPVVKVRLTHHLPYSMHGCWVPLA